LADSTKSPNEPGKEKTVLEEDLPIIVESLELANEAREKGYLISKDINPFGENLDQIFFYLFGDIHQSGAFPEKSVYAINHFPYKYIEGLIFQPRNHFVESLLVGFLGNDFEKLLEEVSAQHVPGETLKAKTFNRLTILAKTP